MLVLHQLPYVLSMLRCTFYAFSKTNILTRCHSASSCFLLFLVSEILHRKYSRNWTCQKHRRPRRSRRKAPGRPHPPQAVWAPWAATDLASPPIYSTPRKNPKDPSTIPRKVPTPPSLSTLVREGSEALPGTLPEREITAGGIFITMPSSEVMRE